MDSRKPSYLMNDFVELRRVLTILRKRWQLLLLCTVSGAILGLGISFLQTPVYEAVTTLMVGRPIGDANLNRADVLLSQELQHKGKVAVLLSLDKVKFRRSVRPGDQLVLEVEAIKVRASTGHIRGRARVGGELAAEAEIKFILTDAEQH